METQLLKGAQLQFHSFTDWGINTNIGYNEIKIHSRVDDS